MGKVESKLVEQLIDPMPDRNANLLRVYRKENGEVVIHFRNFKQTLMRHEVKEWCEGFAEALKNFNEKGYMKNDI